MDKRDLRVKVEKSRVVGKEQIVMEDRGRVAEVGQSRSG